MQWANEVKERGFAVVEGVFGASDLDGVLDELRTMQIPRSRAGMRHVLKQRAMTQLAHGEEMLGLARRIVGEQAIPFRATLFDKSPNSNWLVAWHQDTALPLTEKREIQGWGPWSVKEGIIYAHAPKQALESVVALRLHLDDSNAQNGPLRVLPGTHIQGVLTDEEIHGLAETVAPFECCVRMGGVVLMRPLVVHASSKSTSSELRRVLHIEYAASLIPQEGLELAVA